MSDHKPLPSNVHPIPLGRGTLSFLLDFGFAAGLIAILYFALFGPLIMGHNDYQPAVDEQTAYVAKSGLIEKVEGGYQLYSFEDKDGDYAYVKYLDKVWNYFYEVIPANADISANVDVKSSLQDNVTLKGFAGEATKTNAEYGRWVYETYLGYIEGGEDNIFVPSTAGDFLSAPKVADKYADIAKYYGKLHNAMMEPKDKIGHYVDAANMFNSQPKLGEFASRINLARYAAMAPSFAIPPIIFFFVLPLCLPSGKTLGKLICKEAVIGIDGYSAPKISIILRQAVITFIWLLLALPWQLVCWPLFMLLMLIGYMSHVLSKKSQSIHDKIARTLAIDSKSSVWFASPADEEKFIEEHPTSPIAKKAKKEAEEQSMERAYANAYIEAQERILDLSTINKRREEARQMTSFDEFERQSDAEFAAREEEAVSRYEEPAEPSPEEEAEALKDLAALEGLTPEEAEALAEQPEEPAPEEDEDPDGFTDETK